MTKAIIEGEYPEVKAGEVTMKNYHDPLTDLQIVVNCNCGWTIDLQSGMMVHNESPQMKTAGPYEGRAYHPLFVPSALSEELCKVFDENDLDAPDMVAVQAAHPMLFSQHQVQSTPSIATAPAQAPIISIPQPVQTSVRAPRFDRYDSGIAPPVSSRAQMALPRAPNADFIHYDQTPFATSAHMADSTRASTMLATNRPSATRTPLAAGKTTSRSTSTIPTTGMMASRVGGSNGRIDGQDAVSAAPTASQVTMSQSQDDTFFVNTLPLPADYETNGFGDGFGGFGGIPAGVAKAYAVFLEQIESGGQIDEDQDAEGSDDE